ncbi:MAG: hypothetical protein Q8K79_20625 [Solirubrobacteraceae bacterium]|nr:hypothetical protein [Solirubrobacteraceae bacterium]
MRLHRRIAAVLSATALSALTAPALAGAQTLCRSAANGPTEYQARLGPLVSGFVVETGGHGDAPPPPASTGVGAGHLAAEALGAQFAGFWLSNALQGWVVGVAAGLDPAAARAAVTARVAAHYTAEEAAYLSERLHVDPHPYGDADLRATQAAVSATLAAEAPGTYWAAAIACTLSDARRVEVSVFAPTTAAGYERITALLARFGDQVRAVRTSGGSPTPAGSPGASSGARRVSFLRHVRMTPAARCLRGRTVRIARIPARGGSPAVRSLTVRASGRSRTYAGRRLAKPIFLALRARRTKVVVTVRLADRRSASRTVTYLRCR